MKSYILRSPRLGFRAWRDTDLLPFGDLNQDARVMQYFPQLLDREETADAISRFNQHLREFGYTYYAVDLLSTGEFAGFIGLNRQTYESHFTPCTDIGWRLKFDLWGNGYATEGARACLRHAKDTLRLGVIYSVAPAINLRSIGVMKSIGMTFVEEFQHPLLADNSPLKSCHLYSTSQA